jgi:ribonuclease J
MPLRIIPLGGLGEFGLNSLLFDDGESAVLVDAGLMFPDETMLGIDFVIPDFGCLREVSHRLRALLLTHGHEDHIGAVSFLLKDFDIPVYGTPLTLGLLRNRLEEHGLGDVARLETIKRSGRFPIGDLDVETFPVCHSIPGGFGYILRCRDGVFVHTGDFKIDTRPLDGVKTAMDRLSEVAAHEKVTALFSDSTNVEREGQSLPEAFVGEALSRIFGEAGGRVIVAMFSSNIHRIQEAINAAARDNRKVALCGRSMIGNVETALELGYMSLPHPNILVPVEETETLPGREVVVLTTGSQGEPRSALTLMALGEHKYVRIREGDTAVLSSHVSGHASREELRRMVRLLRPEYFIPVHGEPRHLIMHKALAKEVGVPRPEFVRNGDILEFSEGVMTRAGKAPVGRLFVDGKGVGEVESMVLKDRHHLSHDGMVMVVLAISQATGDILYGPDIVTRGVVSENASDTIMEGARQAVHTAWEEAGIEARKDPAEIKTDIRKALRRFFHKRLDRKPMIIPVILEL